MFSGHYEYTLDDKARLSIPSKFREILAANYSMKLILTKLDGCVVAYPEKEWAEVQKRIAEKGAHTKEARTFLRLFYSAATDCPIDRLGRILVPPSLRTYAGITKNVMIVGMDKRIELWSEESWSELMKTAESDEKMVDIAADFGL